MSSNNWFAGNFCPREATCSEGADALSPSNGPKIRTMNYTDPPQDPMPAEVRQFPTPQSFFQAFTQPDDWAKCEGQLLPIAENQDVFSLLGTSYGGDGRTTFGMPDLKTGGSTDYYLCVNGVTPGFVGP